MPENGTSPDPLTTEQRARQTALAVANDVLAAGHPMGGRSVPEHRNTTDLVDLALFILDGKEPLETWVARDLLATAPVEPEDGLDLGPNERVLVDVAVERQRQERAEGYTLDHDTQHTAGQWANLVTDYVAKALHPACDRPRQRLIQATALLVAWVQTIDATGQAEDGDA